MLAGILHTGIVVVELGMHLVVVKVEVLRLHGRSKGTDRLQRSTPQAGNHVDGKSQRSQRQKETGHADLGIVVVVGELDLSQQVEAQQGEEHNPEGKEGLTVEDAPAVGQVGHGKELQREGQFEEAQRHLDDVHPSARLGHGLEPRGEESEKRERQGQGDGKAQHTDGRSHHIARSGYLYQQEADDGTRTREGYQRQGEGHEEDAQQARSSLGLAVDGIAPTGRQGNLERTEERRGKHHQHEAEEDVEDGVGGKGVERIGTEDGGNGHTQRNVDDHDGGTVGPGVADAFLLVLAALQEEADGHGDDGPHAGSEQGQQTAHKTGDENVEPGHVFL